jgi:hypothetical protein
MNKKIFTLLLVCVAIVSSVSVFASDDLVSHDFGEFKMDIPDCNQDIAMEEGKSNSLPDIDRTTYAIPNPDLTTFAFIDYYTNSSGTNETNLTDAVLNIIKVNHTVDVKDGIYTWEAVEDGHGQHGYLFSSDDDSKVAIVTGADIRLEDALKTFEFK